MGLSILAIIYTYLERIKGISKHAIKSPVFWARSVGSALPILFLIYILYVNFLPFGFEKDYLIQVGSENDTLASEFYLLPSSDLSEKKTSENGSGYRELNGYAQVIFQPTVVLKNVKIEIEDPDQKVSLIPPEINLDLESTAWDYNWLFHKEIPKELDNSRAFPFEDGVYFDGTARIQLASSTELFENGAFSLYVEWMPTDKTGNGQQIIGHDNWELWQNSDSVTFQVGRMNDSKGPAYKITYPIDEVFFNLKHSALAIYSPSDKGYVELYIDKKLYKRLYFGTDKIWKGYGRSNLSFGWTPHNYEKNPHFKGYLYRASIIEKALIKNQSKVEFYSNTISPILISLFTDTTSTLRQIKLHVTQR